MPVVPVAARYGLYPVAAGLGLLVGLLDTRVSEVQGPALLILIFSFALSLARPAGAWRWALLVGGGVPLMQILMPLLGYRIPHPAEPNAFASLLALLPAFLGAGLGALFGGLAGSSHN